MDMLRQIWIFCLVTVHLYATPSSCTDKLFVVDAYNVSILLAETDGLSFVNTTFTRLPFTGHQLPVGVEFDPRTDMVYWTDALLHTVNRGALDGSMQEVLAQLDPISIPENFEYPYGIALNLNENKVYWADQYHDVIEMSDLDGSNRKDLIQTGFNTNPAGLVYSKFRRKIYWTEQGPSPKIETANADGTGREVLVDSDLTSPHGICLDLAEMSLFWTDLDIVKSIHLDEMTILTHFMLSDFDVHPFGIANYFEDLYFSDFSLLGVYVIDYPDKKLLLVDRRLLLPAEIHIYSNTSCPGFNLCADTGECVLTTRQPEDRFVCVCEPGYTGSHCEQDIKECESSPCIHGSCSEDTPATYECTCQPGFTGLNCERNIEFCDPSPCDNGATCMEELLGYACECTVGFTGDTCSEDINECLRADVCGVNEDCTNTNGGYQCACTEGSQRRNGVCKFSLSVGGSVQFTQINGDDAEFTAELDDPLSDEYMALETICYKVLHRVIVDIMSIQGSEWDVSITSFSSGSIVADFTVTIIGSDRTILNDQAATVETSLGLRDPGIWLSTDGSVNLNVESILAYGQVCLSVQCVYGSCRTIPGDPNYWCACQSGYTGEYCETEITCPLPNHPLSHVSQPQSTYMPGDLITIECDEIDASVVWRCDGTTGDWIQLADLDCKTDGNGLPFGALIGIVVGAFFVLLIGMFLCFLYKFVHRKRRNTSLDEGHVNPAANLAMGAVGGVPYPCAEGKSLDEPIYAAPKDLPSNKYTSMYATRMPSSGSDGSGLGKLPAVPVGAAGGVDELPPEYSVCDPRPSRGNTVAGNLYESRIGYQHPPIDLTPSPLIVPKNPNHHYYEHKPRTTQGHDNEYIVVQPD